MKRTVTSILKKSLNAELAVEYFFFQSVVLVLLLKERI